MRYIAGYNKLALDELQKKIDAAKELQKECVLCPRECKVCRGEGERGECGALDKAKIASYGPHFGEERPLVGTKGSGTIFFAYCNLKCVFCQNADLSWEGSGREVSPEGLGKIMLSLQGKGCHNINFVTPTHYIPQILEALYFARKEGLTLPLVYNCGGYESLEVLKVLNGVIDIYMPDLKFDDPEVAA